MLAAGGVLGLLLMGAAVGGLMAGVETPARGDDDDDPSRDTGPDGDDAASEDAPAATWTGDFAGDGSLAADDTPDTPGSALAQLLFGDTSAPTDVAPDLGPDNVFAALDAQHPDTGSPFEGHGPGAMEPGGADLLDITEKIPFSGGPDIPLVSEFDCATDRLILDFDGAEDAAPLVTIDLASSPGDAVVQANGVGVVFVKDAAGLTADHVDIVMSGVPTPSDGPVEPGEIGGDGPHASTFGNSPDETASATGGLDILLTGEPGSDGGLLGRIDDFDREADQIEVIYDPEVVENPTVDIVDFPDGTGACILLNGAPILEVVGAQGLDPAGVALRPSDTPMAASPGLS
jgi:hypothetical protein